MSIVDGHETYEALAEKTNRYEAVRMIAAEARKRANQCNNLISHSEAISWVLTGEKPSKLVVAERRGKNLMSDSLVTDILQDTLCMIDDIQIQRAVESSVKKTIRAKDLVYTYNNIQDESRQARVRVLTRMTWDKILECSTF